MPEKPFYEKFIPNRHKVAKHFPLLAKFIYSFHKGSCDNCLDCCMKKDGWCESLDVKNRKCSIYISRPLKCRVAPFPQDLWWDRRYKRCRIFYPFVAKNAK